MAEIVRKADLNGIPLPLDDDERQTARVAFIQAGTDADKQLAVLKQFPFLGGKDWQRYAAADYLPSAAAPVTKPTQ